MPIRIALLGLCGLSAALAVAAAVSALAQATTTAWLAAASAFSAILALVASWRLAAAPMAALSAKAAAVLAAEGSAPAAGTGEFAVLSLAMARLEDCLETVRGEASGKTRELDACRIASDEAVRQAQEASRLAEQSRAENLLAAAGKLEDVVDRVLESAGSLSNEMHRVCEGAELQRQRMIETAAAMDEMNNAIADISRGSSEASASVESAREYAGESAGIARETVASIRSVNEAATALKENMGSLGEQAKSIDRIINVINDIADQTNLLALNAAIEAARAGEAGRGFAVVADEVRKLAEKTMQATKEVGDSIVSIQQAIQSNVDRMDQAMERTDRATAMAQRAGESAELIERHTQDNSGKIHSIAAASEEQSATTIQISSAIVEVERVANSIADGIHDSTKAVLDLSDLAKELSVLIADLKSGMDAGILVPWTSTLATGVKIIDTQHKKLLGLINTLYAAMKSGQGQSVLQKLLEDLAVYTVSHFDQEEIFFDRFHYAEAAGHKRMHTELKGQVTDYLTKLKSGQADFSMELMHFLRDWLVNHIAKTDMRYVQTFLDNGLERS